jgi:hypothetical protein
MIEIWDCRRKERLVLQRIGGDFEIAVLDEKGILKTKYWFEMKEPQKKNYQKIEDLFKQIQSLCQRQDESNQI